MTKEQRLTRHRSGPRHASGLLESSQIDRFGALGIAICVKRDLGDFFLSKTWDDQEQAWEKEQTQLRLFIKETQQGTYERSPNKVEILLRIESERSPRN